MPFDIHIRHVTNGFIVEAGCMTLAFDSPSKLATEITRWLHDHRAVEREYLEKYRPAGGDPVPFQGEMEVPLNRMRDTGAGAARVSGSGAGRVRSAYEKARSAYEKAIQEGIQESAQEGHSESPVDELRRG